ncbi:hypothetical protein SLE2022_246480 [Rubroshorea leprosula]|uniref:Pentatricopeptide repeat-containing protein n=1 Tax=Rubroshorea leprosula TaxID=152421 RepID=A0AAV5HL13_9ROSI|nr:hypothetical protein SLEP1_g890 [Rubroshorea leprosula]
MGGLCKNGQVEKAYDSLGEMEEKGCPPNVVSFNTLISYFSQINETAKVVELLQKMAKKELFLDTITCSVILELLKLGDETCQELLSLIPMFPA